MQSAPITPVLQATDTFQANLVTPCYRRPIRGSAYLRAKLIQGIS